jgi:methylglutaconyl-CoA hydratase
MSLKLAQLMQILHNHIKPTIILITGATYGGGIGLVACCDIAIATQNAIFCFSEVRLGLVPAIISPYIVKAIGKRIALRYFLTAENFDAQEAWRIGLVHHVISENELEDDLNKITDALLAASPNALAKLITEIRNTSEAKEGISAFLQKRKARWVKKSP